MKRILRKLLPVAGFFVLILALLRILRRHVHFPAPAFIGYFLDSDWRRRLQRPDRLIARSGIQPGMHVLEVGCGSGAFITFVARHVGPQGSVAALDIQPAMLAQLERKLQSPEHRDITNLTLHQGSATDLPFDDATFDVVYMVTVYYEIPDRDRALAEAQRVLRPGGFLAISEFLPDPDYRRSAVTVAEGRAAGFELDGVQGTVWTYTARFRKPPVRQPAS